MLVFSRSISEGREIAVSGLEYPIINLKISFISKTELEGIKPQEKLTKIMSHELKGDLETSIKQQTYFLQLYN